VFVSAKVATFNVPARLLGQASGAQFSAGQRAEWSEHHDSIDTSFCMMAGFNKQTIR
jgi:hypothetical protein